MRRTHEGILDHLCSSAANKSTVRNSRSDASRSPPSHSKKRRWEPLAVLSAVALTCGMLQPIAAYGERPSAESDEESMPARASTQLDRITAMYTARLAGVEVEDLSARTESMSVFAQPDGTWRIDSSIAPHRVKDTGGTWQPVNLDLELRNGRWVPKVAVNDLSFSAGGGSDFVRWAQNSKDGSKGSEVGLRLSLIHI